MNSIQGWASSAINYFSTNVPGNEKLAETIVTKCATEAIASSKSEKSSKVIQYVTISTVAASISMASDRSLLKDIATFVAAFFLLAAAGRSLTKGD